MRNIDSIIIHSSATKEHQPFSAHDIDVWHKKRGFKKIGYHWVIKLDGTLEQGRDEGEIGAHTQGHNANSIGICYIGGMDGDGKPKDTRTPSQFATLRLLVQNLLQRYPTANVYGHRDFARTACPSFDVRKESWR